MRERLRTLLDGRLSGYLRTDEASRALWSTDASIYLRKPVGVVVDFWIAFSEVAIVVRRLI